MGTLYVSIPAVERDPQKRLLLLHTCFTGVKVTESPGSVWNIFLWGEASSRQPHSVGEQ